MELQEGIQKVLTKLAGDSALQNELKKDPETVIKNAAGDGLEAGDLDKIISGAKNISADSRKVVAFTGLLGVPTCIPGLARLLSQTGGYDLLMGYIARDETSAGPSIRALGILTQLLGSSAGTDGLIRLIGSAPETLPDLNVLMALFAGSGDSVQQQEAPAPAGGKKEDKKPEKTGDSLLDALGSIFGV